MQKSLGLLSLVLILALFAACGPTAVPSPAPSAVPTTASAPEATAPPAASPAPVTGGRLVWGRSGYGDNYDPHKYTHIEAAIVLINVLDPLVWRNPADNKFYPGLAKSWEWSADGKSLTLELRNDVKFHDGTPFNAEAVKFNFDRIADPATAATTAASYIGPYVSTEVLGPYTARVNFEEPFVPFLEWLTYPALSPVSPTAVKTLGDKFGDAPVGAGPFRWKSWDRQNFEVVLERNPDYNWAPSFFKHQGPPYLDTLVFKGIIDTAARLAALEAGEVDMANLIPETDVVRLKADPKYQVWFTPVARIGYNWTFNVTHPPLDELPVRQAMVMALDLEGMNQTVYRGLYQVPEGPFSHALPCHDATAGKILPYDPEKAKSLLEGAGWKVGADGIRERDGKKLSLTFIWPDADDTAPIVFAQAEWRKIGVDVQIEMMDFNTWVTQTYAGNHDMTWGTNSSSDPDAARAVWGSQSKRNAAQVKDSELDLLLDQGYKTTDPEKRCEIYRQVQKIVMEKAYSIPYSDKTNIEVGLAGITGSAWHAGGVYPLNYDLQAP